MHDRPLVVRRTTVDTTTYGGIAIDGYDEARAARFPNTFRRPTRGKHGAETTTMHCLACTLEHEAWRDGVVGPTPPPHADGVVDARCTVPLDATATAAVVERVVTARDVPVAVQRFEAPWGYVRLGGVARGITEIWWDDWLVPGRTDVAVRTSPHDEDAARELIDAIAAAAPR